MKRVLKITATNGGTTAKVRIEVDCLTRRPPFWSTRLQSRVIILEITDGVMEALREASYLRAPLSTQRVGR